MVKDVMAQQLLVVVPEVSSEQKRAALSAVGRQPREQWDLLVAMLGLDERRAIRRVHRRKLTPGEIEQVRVARANGVKLRVLAERFGVSRSTISKVVKVEVAQ